MQILIDLVKTFEGLHKLKKDGLVYPYMCPANYPTQGWGILVENMSVPPITREEADRLMEKALPYYIAQTLKAVPNLQHAPPEILMAITDFTFNLGAARLRSSTLRRKLLAEDWEGARHELKKWKYGGGKVLPGLVKRRSAESAIIALCTGQ